MTTPRVCSTLPGLSRRWAQARRLPVVAGAVAVVAAPDTRAVPGGVVSGGNRGSVANMNKDVEASRAAISRRRALALGGTISLGEL